MDSIYSHLVKVETLSEVCRDIGQVFFASFVAGSLLENTIRWGMVFAGLFLSIAFWIFSVIINKK